MVGFGWILLLTAAETMTGVCQDSVINGAFDTPLFSMLVPVGTASAVFLLHFGGAGAM